MVNRTQLPDDPDAVGKVLEAEAKERGLLGRIFGSKEHAPTNIAALALVLVSVGIAVLIFGDLPDDVERGGLLTTLIGTFTFIIGTIYGRGREG